MTQNGLTGWKLDTGKEGTRILFKDYQKAIIDNLINDPGGREGWTSGEMNEALKTQGVKISRASVIFYMNFLVADGLATYTEETGKGGWHRVYEISKTWAEVKRHVIIRVVEALGKCFDEDVDEVLAGWVN